jgi:circadian clock protein KaiC
VARPTYSGLEMHLVNAYKLIQEFRPAVAVIDPITSLANIGTQDEVKAMLMRMIDIMKNNSITTFCTSLTHGDGDIVHTEVAVTSLIDTWLLVRQIEYNGERTRVLYVLKSRGMAHSNQIREFLITNQGIDLTDVYVGRGMVLTGSARKVQEMKEEMEAEASRDESQRAQRDMERKRQIMESKIEAIRAEYSSMEDELLARVKEREWQEKALAVDRGVMADMRRADTSKEKSIPKKQGNKGVKK